jgi:NAD(P)-dependent dehydrogenase (short-subunit alcohol dehydrogenase family)
MECAPRREESIMDITGTHALITGGGSGIGRATAILLAEKGAKHITLVDVNATGLDESAELVRKAGAGATTVTADVSDAAALEQAFSKAATVAPIDIVFNNAGVVSGAHLFPTAPASRVQQVFGININGVVIGTQLAVEHMKGRKGVVINTVSTSYNNTAFRDVLYSTSKAAVAQFTQASAQIEEPTGVRVCGVSPGLVQTPILDTTGGDKRAEWMTPILANNRALPPLAIAEGVVQQIEDDGSAGTILTVREEWFEKANA